MKPRPETESDAALREAAARWMIRRDRGLSAAESIEYELWLAADERHARAMRRSAGAWSLLDRVPEPAAQRVVDEATRRRTFWRRTMAVGGLAAAVAVAAVGFLLWSAAPLGKERQQTAQRSERTAGPRTLTLADGTRVRLNAGSEIVEQFTTGERRVRLARGEAHFTVTENRERPFVVRAGSIDVRAVGTAFNVVLQSAAVEVLVTEGVVKLDSSAAMERAAVADAIPLLKSGQRAVVALAPVSPEVAVAVTTLSEAEMARALAWQEPLLRLGGATLAEVAASFERRTGRRVVLADPALADLRLGGRFRADDVEGFAHLLATTLDIEVERGADGSLTLRKKTSSSR